MKTKKILSFVLALAMIMAVVPSFGLVASAADEVTLFDVANLTISGEQAISTGGWTATESGAAVRWNQNWGTNGVWGSTGTYALMFFFSNSRGSNDGNVTAAIDTASDTDGATKVTVDFNFATQEASNIYQTWNFRDVDGNTYAKLAFDRNSTVRLGNNSETAVTESGTTAVYGFRGTNIKIVTEKTSATAYTITYYVAGEQKVQETVSAANGFGSILANVPKWNDQWSAAGLQDLKITYEKPDTLKEVTATYTAGGDTAETVTKTYNASEATGVTFPAKTVYYNGDIYTAPETTLSESGNIAMTKSARYATYSAGETISYDGKSYNVTGDSILANGNFATGDTLGWTNRPGTAITGASIAYDSEVEGNAMTISTSGAGATNSIGTRWNVTSGQTYYISFYVGGSKPTSGNYQYNRVFQSDGSTEIVTYGADMTDGAWKRFEKVFTATGDTILFQGSWASNIKYANVQVLPVEEDTSASVDVTVNYYYDSAKNNLFKSVTKSVVKGESVTFDAVQTTYEGKYYATDAATYENVTAAATYDIVLTEDTTKAVVVDDFSYNFNTGEVIWAGDNGYSSADKTGTISIGWNNYRQTVMTFAIAPESGKMVTSAKLTVKVGFTNNDGAPYTVYAIDPKYVDYENGTMKDVTTGRNWPDRETVKSELGAVQVGYHSWIPKGQTTTLDLDLSGVSSYLSDGVLALLIESTGQAYTDTAANGNAPYLSDITRTSAGTATIKYTGVTADDATYTYLESDALGYDDEKTFPNVPIASFDGYVFKNKTVSGDTITLNYEAAVTDMTNSKVWFYSNVDNADTLVSLNMLGAHDAFTSKIGEGSNKFDAAAIAQGDSGAKSAVSGASTAIKMSKAQSGDALEMLNNGVRYFDIRLSRSNKTAKGGLLSTTTVAHTNSVFYTTHGMLGEEFRPIAYTIGQWLKAHPGELVVLDFQEVYDYTDDHDGNSDSATWTAINSILEESGINSYVRHNKGNASIKAVTYGDLTDNGASAGVVLWGRYVATNAGVGKFMLRHVGQDGTSGLFNGHLYSNYEPTNGEEIGSSLSEDYIKAQVDDMAVYANEDANGDHPIVWMQRVMQAQSESSNLLSQASSDNTKLVTALTNNNTWLTALPIVMINDAVNAPAELFSMIQNANNHEQRTVQYYCGDTFVTAKEKSAMVGTLYTGDVENGLVTYDGTDVYVVETAPVTAPSNSADLVLVPYGDDAIKVNVKKLDSNVFTMRNGAIFNSTTFDNDTENTGWNSFGAYNWGDAGTYDRIGVAILDFTIDEYADNYVLGADKYRHGQNNASANSAKLYAFTIGEFMNLDLSDTAAVYAALTEDKLVATGSTTGGNDSSTFKNAAALDVEKMNSAGSQGGKVVIIGTANNSLYGLAGNFAITSYYKAPTVTAQLGFNADGDFAIDFVFGNFGVANVDARVYKEAGLGATDEVFIGSTSYKVTEDDKTFQVSTNDSNAIYRMKAENSAAPDTTSTTVRAALYTVVIDAIINGNYDKDTNPLTATNLAKVNAILEKGGLYTDADGNLSAETAKIVQKNDDGTYSLTEVAQKAGIVMTLNDTQVQEVEVYMLEAVQLEFVPELIQETVVDEVVDIESGSFEDIM